MQVSGFWLNIQMNKKPHTNQAQQPPKSKSRKISTTTRTNKQVHCASSAE